MAYLQPDKPEKVYLPAIKTAKENGEKLVCLTAYDYPTARIVALKKGGVSPLFLEGVPYFVGAPSSTSTNSSSPPMISCTT